MLSSYNKTQSIQIQDMTKFILTIASILMFSTITFGATPPSEVLNAFNKKFPTSKNVKWDKENSHEYEASFSIDNHRHSSNFTDKGEWLETESPITFLQLPMEVQTIFTNSHENTKPKLVSKIEQANGSITYEIEIQHGIKTVEIFYTADGTVINKK